MSVNGKMLATFVYMGIISTIIIKLDIITNNY